MATVEMFTMTEQDIILDEYLLAGADAKVRIYLYWNEDVNNLLITSLSATIINRGSIQRSTIELSDLDGSNRLFSIDAVIESPPGGSGESEFGTFVITLAANAVDEGNVETSITFNWKVIEGVATTAKYADGDFPEWELLKDPFRIGEASMRIKDGVMYARISNGSRGRRVTAAFDLQGNRDASKDISLNAQEVQFVEFDGEFILGTNHGGNISTPLNIYNASDLTLLAKVGASSLRSAYITRIKDNYYVWLQSNRSIKLGTLGDWFKQQQEDGGVTNRNLPGYGEITFDYEGIGRGGRPRTLAYDNNGKNYGGSGYYLHVYDDDFKVIPGLSRRMPKANMFSIAIYGDYLYGVTSSQGNFLYRVEIRKLEKPKRRQKIYPIFVNEGDTIDVTKYVSYMTKLVWDKGYTPPDYISISGTGIVIARNTGLKEETAIEIKVKAFNKHGATDDNNFKFYIVIKKAAAPIVDDVKNVSMPPHSEFDVRPLVDAADSFSSLTLPTGASFSGSVIRIGATGGAVSIRATKDGLNAVINFNVDIIRKSTSADYSDVFRYRLEIAGIDVTEDLQQDPYPEVSNTLDPVNVNEYIVNNATLKLDNLNGYFNGETANNFWSTHSLNPNGYLEPVQLFIESLVNGVWISNLLFVGIILETIESINSDLITLNCVDSSFLLKNRQSKGGGIEKYARSLRSQRQSYEGIYNFEESVLPISEGSAQAWSGDTKLTIKTTRNPSEGVNIDDSAYAGRSQILTQGGRLDSVPLAKFRTPHRYRNTTFSVNELSKVGKIFNPDNQISNPDLGYDFIQNKGNIQFNTQNTRITHIPQDWVYDSTNQKIYILLSNPGVGYSDILVEHDIASDSQTILKEFDDDITCTQIASSDGNIFYIMTTTSINLDRSLYPVPEDNTEVISRYDPLNGAKPKILKYVRTSGRVSDFVGGSASQLPLIAVHYHVGFSNGVRTFDWESIVPENRASFRLHNNQLYYRYWREEGFGVARVTSGGAITELTRRTSLSDYNYMNFAFDLDSSRNTYMVYFEGTPNSSTIKIRKITNGGTESQLFTLTKTLSDLTDISKEGGWWSGIYEVKEHNGDLYFIAGVGHTDKYEDNTDNGVKVKSQRKGASCVLYKIDLSNTSAGLQVIEKYDFVQAGIRSLTIHKNAIHYIESPSVSYKFENFNTDITETFSLGLDRNRNEDLGKLKRINASDEVEDLGNMWYTTFPYRSTNMPMLSVNNELHMIMSSGKLDNVLRTREPANRNNNFQWLKYGNKLEYVLDTIPTGNVYNVLVDIAKKTNSLFLIQQNRISLLDKDPYRAKLNGSITNSDTALNFDGVNKSFEGLPSARYVAIDDEIISFSGKTSSKLTGLKRGVAGSQIQSHSNNADILYLDNIIAEDSYLKSSLRLDTNRFFNVVQEPNLILEKRDAMSIADFEKVFTLDLGLSRHHTAWIDYMYQKYLDDLKELRFFVNVILKPSFYISLGDIVSFYYDNKLLKPFRVTTINYKRDRTEIQGRTI